VIEREEIYRVSGNLVKRESALGNEASKMLVTLTHERDEIAKERDQLVRWREQLVKRCNEAGMPRGIPVWEAYRQVADLTAERDHGWAR
jgi:hypothetical protein